jgi:hypothetical protein
MRGICAVCGKLLEGEYLVAWKFLDLICGGCFFPLAEYVLDHIEELEWVTKNRSYLPGFYGFA